MANGSRTQMWPAAALVAVAVVVGSFLVAGALDRLTAQVDRATGRLAKIETAVADAKGALGNIGAARPAQQARRGPDPKRRYTFKLAAAPKLGPDSAKVKIIEFSDFQ